MFFTATQHCMIHHTVHKKVNHSTEASQKRSSEAASLAWAPGRTDMLARAMGITCVEDLPDHNHMLWEVKQAATGKQPTWLLLL